MTQIKTDLLKQADEVYADYLKKRYHGNAFQDAVVTLLWMMARLMISKDKKAK